jgi:hypothetical protein
MTAITKLYRSSHSPGEEMCLMEAVAFVAGEKWSDHPQCCCPVIAAFGRRLNDWLDDDERQQLIPYVKRLIDTRGDAALEQRRALMAADWAVRTIMPIALRAAGLHEHANRLEALPAIVSQETAEAAKVTAQAASAAAGAVEAAEAAAWAANAAATRARAAAWAAAWAANAAWAAVPSARPEIIALSFALFDRMIEVGRKA